jgi:hypothetical protein
LGQVINSWGLTTAEEKELKNYYEKFEKSVNLQANFLLARYKLRTLSQGN